MLDDNQFEFRSGHSCEEQLISVIEEVQAAMDCRYQVPDENCDLAGI